MLQMFMTGQLVPVQPVYLPAGCVCKSKGALQQLKTRIPAGSPYEQLDMTLDVKGSSQYLPTLQARLRCPAGVP